MQTMSAATPFHFVTVGTSPELVRHLWDPITEGSRFRFSHIVHPSFDRASWHDMSVRSEKHFFVDQGRIRMPAPDRAFLSSLEREGVPTIHNMILSDRVVSKLPYEEALGYATFLAKRLMDVIGRLQPMAVIGGFDAVHGSLALAVAKKMAIPWYALHFSVIPEGFACFCDQASPSARVLLEGDSAAEKETLASKALQQFEAREIVAPAYVVRTQHSLSGRLAKMASRLSTLSRMLRGAPAQRLLRYTEPRSKNSVASAVLFLGHAARARKAVTRWASVAKPPSDPYVLFGLHMQPESSIDVWAPFYSNQIWVIELLSRSIPPTHKLLVKIHKSDTANYSSREIRKMSDLPGVDLIAPFADARRFIENADLIILIQGTMGLEAALLGKPVIMLGQSPFTLFPSVAQLGEITELPTLVRKKLHEPRPARNSILKSYAEYLGPFAPASANDWAGDRKTVEIENYRRLFDRLREHIVTKAGSFAESDQASI